MGYESGELKTMQSGKEIDLNTTVPAIVDCFNALKQSKTGKIIGSEDKISDNKKKLNQIRGLSLLISTQETAITFSRAQIEYRSKSKWAKNNKGKEDLEKDSFDELNKELSDMKYDFNKLLYWSNFLKNCRKSILIAEKTKRLDDDFMTKKETNEGEIFELTDNFWEMLEDLEACFSAIHLLMYINKVISSGIEEDEELTYKEQEEAFIKRVIEV